MASDETLALANHYLEKHNTPDEKIGIGPLLESGIVVLSASPMAMLDGSIILEIRSGNYTDCRTVAQRLYLDILEHNPELKPRIVMQGGGVQNWVEISDPKTGETIQIDATPWYGRLNPGLVGKEDTMLQVADSLSISKKVLRIFSVRRTETEVITMGIMSFLPQVSIKQKLAEIRKLKDIETTGNIGIIPYDFNRNQNNVEYRFIFQIESRLLDWPPGKPAENYIHVYVNVLDSDKLQWLLSEGNTLEELITAKAIEIGFTFLDDTDYNLDIPSSLSFMRELAEKQGKLNLFEEFERNISRIMLLLRQAKRKLDVYRDRDSNDASYVDVKHGLISQKLNKKLKGDDIDPLGIDWERKYSDINKLFSTQKMFSIIEFPSVISKIKKINTG